MNKNILAAALLMSLTSAFAQKNVINEINSFVTQQEVQPPLMFLSADEMRGRDTGSPELNIAANFIASQFRQAGLKAVPGAENYFQYVNMEKTSPLESASMTIKGEAVAYRDQFVALNAIPADFKGEFVFVGYGGPDEMPADLKGKMVVAIAGQRDGNPQQVFGVGEEKVKRVMAAGGAGLIEYFVTMPFPWPAIVNYLSGPRISLKRENASGIPHLWMKDLELQGFKDLKTNKSVAGTLSLHGNGPSSLVTRNVVGMVEGTDQVLKNEYMVISGHYDHVGVGAKKEQDSIYNGARDNALGTVAVMTAARYFAKHPAKRSIIFMALTGEEKGLLGSAWYVDHPLVPLKQTVFNFDCDGAGYNDKSLATIIGLDRTSAEKHIHKGCEAFGLKAGNDPVPEQNLYERSDNYNFAKMGVPAIDFAPGIKAFDEELMKYYHQPADEAVSLDFDYLVKYYKAFIYANSLIANDPVAPSWKAGDKYEETGKKLYQK